MGFAKLWLGVRQHQGGGAPHSCHVRAQVGGKLGGVFDEDPRRWRMVAEAFLTAGLALEIATAFSPGMVFSNHNICASLAAITVLTQRVKPP